MMENILKTSSDQIDTSSLNSHSDRSSPVAIAEFDGETVLCRVCGDRASGFHYGVHACEGCKGFFRRSIQQKIQYRPCLKNQQCNIQRCTRNRCQYCRLKKCISVGMSRDAVRFGRVPKKEKARIIEQMQKKNMASQSTELNTLLSNDFDVVSAVVSSHRQTCDITQYRANQMRELALHNQEYVTCPANMACPLNNEIGMDTNANGHDLTDFSESFTPAIKSVVDFAKGIPGFVLLNQDDQVTLLKAGTFEVLLLRLACLFDPTSNTMMFTGGKLFKRSSSTMTTNAGFLLDSMFDFAERFNKMSLIDEEIALFSAVVLMSPDRPGLRNVEQVERIQIKLSEALQNIINLNHKEDGTLFAKLIMKTSDLRTLNTLHSEKSIAGQSQRANQERRERPYIEDSDMDYQDSLSTRSGRSSPTTSESSNMTMTSGYSGETDNGNNIVVGQRLPMEASNHQQQVVLRTPYGTFYREEMSGFYGMMGEQPRRRCNTLDRDTLTKPRLHTIEEGNRRRYTLDRDYINKMVNRLNDRLETRTVARGDSLPPSMSSSANSSPIQEERNNMYNAPPPSSFTPIKVPESSCPMGHSVSVTHTSPLGHGAGPSGTHTSPLGHHNSPLGHHTSPLGHVVGPSVTHTSPLPTPESAAITAKCGSSPASPLSRSRSGSFTNDDYLMRPRCYSFNVTSDGRAARIQHKLRAERAEELEHLSSDSSQYMSSEMRRGSVGATYGLHSRKPSIMPERPQPYMNRGPSEMDKRSVQTGMKVMPENSMYGVQITPEMLASKHPNMWHQQASMAMGMNQPMAMPHQRPVETRPRGSEVAKILNGDIRDFQQREINSGFRKYTGSYPQNEMKTSTEGKERLGNGIDQKDIQERLQQNINHSPVSQATLNIPSSAMRMPASRSATCSPASLQLESSASRCPSSADGASIGGHSKTNSERSSPVSEDIPAESFGHKKFDKFRKEKNMDTSCSSGGTQGSSVSVKQEKIDDEVRFENKSHDLEYSDLKVDISNVKEEQWSPSSNIGSPMNSSDSASSPGSSDRPKLSAKEAHPNLLAHLMNGGNKGGNTGKSPTSQPIGQSPTAPSPATAVTLAALGLPIGLSWAANGQGSPNACPYKSQTHQQQQHFKHQMYDSQSPSAPSPPSLSVTSHLLQPNVGSHSMNPDSRMSNQSSHQSGSNITNGNSPNNIVDPKLTNSKEEFHAVTVSHLKDKLMRKIDSNESIQKYQPASDAVSWSMIQTLPSSISSTADLNRELATKLTLASSVISPSMPLTSGVSSAALSPFRSIESLTIQKDRNWSPT